VVSVPEITEALESPRFIEARERCPDKVRHRCGIPPSTEYARLLKLRLDKNSKEPAHGNVHDKIAIQEMVTALSSSTLFIRPRVVIQAESPSQHTICLNWVLTDSKQSGYGNVHGKIC